MRIKICGITNVADAELAAGLGVDAIGLNGYPRSPRYVTAEQAAEIVSALPSAVQALPVLVRPTGEELHARCPPAVRTVQLHDAHGADLAQLAEPLAKSALRIIVAAPFLNLDHLRMGRREVELWRGLGVTVAGLLVDARVDGQFGGTGQTAPWRLLEGFDAGVPLYLAGGLTPENVGEAVRIVRPFAVDVAGGVESAPGKKDAEKLRRFVAAAREAAQELGI